MATYASKGDMFIDNTIDPKAIRTVSGEGKDSGSNSGSGLSSFWKDCPLAASQIDPGAGYGIQDDFTDVGLGGTITTIISNAGTGKYLVFGDAGATIVPDVAIGGGLALTNDTTDKDQVSIATKQQPYQVITTAGDLWFECRAKINSITTQVAGVAIGLMDSTAQTTAVPMVDDTAALADINFIGFNKLAVSTTSINAVYKANGKTESATASSTLTDQEMVADTYFKVGFKYSNGTLSYYINGELLKTVTAAIIAGVDFPGDVTLRPVASVTNGTAGASILTLDWWKCFQTR